jgi:hypothetical protein
MAGALPFIKEEEKRRITTQPYRILNPGTNPVTKGLQQRSDPAVVADKCLNYLSSSHRRADFHLPTRCFNCHRLHHHLRDCNHALKSYVLHVWGVPEALFDVGGRRLV